MDENGNLKYSYCSKDNPCPPGWMQTEVNDCNACPTVGNREEIIARIEQDQPGSSQSAVFD
jgi:hypothetical protein